MAVISTFAPSLTLTARNINKPRLQIRALRRAGCRRTARVLRAPTPTSGPKTRFARNGPQAISPTYRGVCLHHHSESRRDVSASLKRRYSSATQRVSCRSCYLARGLVCHVILSHAPNVASSRASPFPDVGLLCRLYLQYFYPGIAHRRGGMYQIVWR